ncbi:MAG TPA: glycosyltransferase [Thermoanaerobaculia bacterium]
MRIAQLVLPNASEFDRKCQRADLAVLSEKHEVTKIEGLTPTPAKNAGKNEGLTPTSAKNEGVTPQLAHAYGTPQAFAAAFVRFPIPYVASSGMARSRWSFRNPVPPAHILDPLEFPEPVEAHYFEAAARPVVRERKVVASARRGHLDDFIQRTLVRIHRFRDDVEWHLVDSPPSPETLAGVDLWVDPSLSDGDLDGFVAEAVVVGTKVVAARTAINRVRLEEGRSGFLVPVNDPNEMTHAILAALFKSEVAESRQTAARQTVGKFRPRQRYRALIPLYERLIE